MPSPEPARGRGRPRKTEHPRKLGPIRVTPQTLDVLDQAAAVSGRTKREIAEAGVANEARRILGLLAGTSPWVGALGDTAVKLVPFRLTPETWDLLDRAAPVSGLTKREIAETGIAAEARSIINGLSPEPATEGTNNAAAASSEVIRT